MGPQSEMTNNYHLNSDGDIEDETELSIVLQGLVSIFETKMENISKFGLNPRSFDQVIKISRQIAYVKQVMNNQGKSSRIKKSVKKSEYEPY